jgi:hypothetical protein
MRLLNEFEYAENVVGNGINLNRMFFDIKILAKHYLKNGIKYQDLENELKTFCEKNITNFNYVLYFKQIESACRYAKNNTLFKIKPIRITDIEYNTISQVDNVVYEKLLFTMLVLSKIGKQSYMHYIKDKLQNTNTKKQFKFTGYYVNESIYEIFKLADVKTRNKEQRFEILSALRDLGFIDVTLNGKIIVKLVNNHSEKDKIVISKFENFILYYMQFRSEKVIHCEKCKEIEKKRSNKTKYCKKCAKEIKKEQDRKADEKYRKKLKTRK